MNNISKAVVTGGAGFIGSHIVEELLRLGIETFVIDDFSTGSIQNLQKHLDEPLLHIISGDARNIDSLLGNVQNIDVVFHEAAIVSVPRSINEPKVVHDVNVNMTLDVMDYCVKHNVGRFVFASSAAVYGIVEGSANEELYCKPISPYGASKLCIENYLISYNHSFGLKFVALRYFNVYGPRQRMNDYSGVITVFTNQLLSKQTPVIDGDGKQVRDFISVCDIVKANILAMTSQKMIGGIFNVATGNSTSILELFHILKEITGNSQMKPKFGPARPGDVKMGLSDVSKIKNDIDFKNDIEIATGLKGVVDYLSKRMLVEH